jgi:hypothetical protein
MNPTLRNILAVVAGVVACLFTNGALLSAMMKLNPGPAGFDPNVPSTYALLGARHLLDPFAAHALGSLVGAGLAALLAAHSHRTMALVVGFVHLLGGIAAAFLIPAPTWFIALDLLVAYLPMAWLGWKLSGRPA